jgi:hypothetical protein
MVTKISEIKEENLQIVVPDPLFRKHYFKDSEVIGWLLKKDEKEQINYYHLYRRAEDIEEPVFFENEALEGEVLKKERQKLCFEVNTQDKNGEDPEILKKLVTFGL